MGCVGSRRREKRGAAGEARYGASHQGQSGRPRPAAISGGMSLEETHETEAADPAGSGPELDSVDWQDSLAREKTAGRTRGGAKRERKGASRYAVTMEETENEDDGSGERLDANGNIQPSSNRTSGKRGEYTNIGDFEAESAPRPQRRKRRNRREEPQIEVSSDLRDFASSLKDSKPKRSQKTSRIMVGEIEALPGQKLGSFDQSDETMPNAEFVFNS